MYSILRKMHKGFTLVETLVAISILLLVIVGFMTVAQKGIQTAYFARDQITAVFLAQEAIEAIRQFRDDDALKAFKEISDSPPPYTFNTWYRMNDIINDCKIPQGECVYMRDTNEFKLVGVVPVSYTSSPSKIGISSGGRYGHGDTYSELTPFSRVMRITDSVEVGGEIVGVEVTVTVSWTASSFGGLKEVILKTWIYDDYKYLE